MTAVGMPVRVFISHASTDLWVACQIERHLRDAGASTFLDDRDILAGDDFAERINAEAPLCSELMVLATPWSILRPWVLYEVACFRFMRRRIVVVLHGVSEPAFRADGNIGAFLARTDLLDINRLDTYFRDVASRVAADKEPNRHD